MGFFDVVFAIVLTVGIAFVVREDMITKRKKYECANGDADGQARRIAALEERVKVLETIVTDRKFTLGQEIENL